MKLSNFKLTHDGSDGTQFASVDVTTGFWPFRKTRRAVVYSFGTSWRFAGTGEFIPAGKIEKLSNVP